MKKIKWTVIDTLIIIAIAVVGFVGYKMFFSNTNTSSQKSKTEIVVMVTNKNKGFADAVRVGEKATLSLTEKDGGVVTKVVKEPSKIMTFDILNGSYKNVPNDEKEDVYIYLEEDCYVSDQYIKTGDTIVRVGESVAIRGKGYASEGFVVQINEGGDK